MTKFLSDSSILSPIGLAPAADDDEAASLAEFHAGTPRAMRDLYLDHFADVQRAVARVLRSADEESVVHEVFCRIISDAGLRASFQGGSRRAWIGAVARHAAIDHWRRSQRERPIGTCLETDAGLVPSFESSVEARQVIARFQEERLPAKWRAVFELRFVRELDQSEAARTLGMRRTTLLYQELRIRRLLRAFLLRLEGAAVAAARRGARSSP